jgi:metal-responsive CopG/Arc/MetJ family transcriptional regulator
VKITPSKLAVTVDIFIARLEAQRSSNVQDVIRNLIEALMQLEIFY